MEMFLKDISELNLAPLELCKELEDGSRVVDGVFLVNDSEGIERLRVVRGDVASRVIYIHSEDSSGCNLVIDIEAGASLHFVEVSREGVSSEITFNQGRDSHLDITTIQLEQSEANYCVELNGEGAEASIDLLQIGNGEQQVTSRMNVRHNVANCMSNTTSKAIAGGASRCEFRGIVYVAPDAQRTEAYQNSRNVALTEQATIVADPQLEIYADDVKCSHGATVGQMNSDAIFYMCQRGLSESQARVVQLEGFASQVAYGCKVEEVREALSSLISGHLMANI